MEFEEFLKHIRKFGNPIPQKEAYESVGPILLYPMVRLTVTKSIPEEGLTAGEIYYASIFCGPRGTPYNGVLLRDYNGRWLSFSEVSAI